MRQILVIKSLIQCYIHSSLTNRSKRYENGDPLIRFTEAQLAEIRKATVAKVVCDNADNIDTVQRSAFDQMEPFLYVTIYLPKESVVHLDAFHLAGIHVSRARVCHRSTWNCGKNAFRAQ